MPCTITSNESVIPLLQNAIEVASQTDTYISLRMPDAINTDVYTKWVNKLKGGISNDDEIIVTTHVSKYVPKDSFIPDGMSAFARNVKRVGDFILSLIALVVFSPLFLICYIAILFSSKNVSVGLAARFISISSVPCVWMPKSSDRSLAIAGVTTILV